jgi:hypothetical protein
MRTANVSEPRINRTLAVTLDAAFGPSFTSEPGVLFRMLYALIAAWGRDTPETALYRAPPARTVATANDVKSAARDVGDAKAFWMA